MPNVVLNRSSLEPMYSSYVDAAAELANMIRGLVCLEDDIENDRLVFRTHANPYCIPLVEREDGDETLGSVVDSLFDNPNTHDLANFFRAIESMSPADTDLSDDALDIILGIDKIEVARGYEQTIDLVEKAGLDAKQCAVTQSILISFSRKNLWQFDRMAFWCNGFPDSFIFDHVANEQHGLSVSERQRNNARKGLTARNFWQFRERLFSNLLFGQDVEGQIEIFDANMFGLAITKLTKLDRLSQQYRNNLINITREVESRYGIVPESAQTMANYRNNRIFSDYRGRRLVFEKHIWVGLQYRIHIFIHENPRIIEIGYMGAHLPTVLYPT
jgi:hypothetical protein